MVSAHMTLSLPNLHSPVGKECNTEALLWFDTHALDELGPSCLSTFESGRYKIYPRKIPLQTSEVGG